MRQVTILLVCLCAFVQSSKAAAPTFDDLVVIYKAHMGRKAAKRDFVMESELATWISKITAVNIEGEWKRLAEESRRYRSAQNDAYEKSIGESAHGMLAALFYKQAVNFRSFDLVSELLCTRRIGFVGGFDQPEFHLVKSAGPPAFAHFFKAYDVCVNAEQKAWLASRIMRSFGKLGGEVWHEDEGHDIAVSAIRKWYQEHVGKLRCVEVYVPMSGRQFFYEQGIKEDERLIGLFFVSQK